MRFSDSFLDEIRDRVPISSVIGSRVSWDKRKTNTSRGDWWACCPFHGEKSPSFHCEDKKGRYHCFGCGVSGDHFRFLTDLEGLSFPEAVERVAEMAGVPMPARDAEQERREQKRTSLTDVMEMAARWFQERLQAPEGAKARAYLRDRGLTLSTVERFRIGYSPDSRNALKEFLVSKGVGQEAIEACGLVVHGTDIAVSYDRFRDRIMFPIEDVRGRVIAFGGRALSPDVSAKYLNSPETEIFHKGSVLYNMKNAKSIAAKTGTVVAVEGYMDVIALSQAGFENVVAPLGTALTEEQFGLLWRLGSNPVLCFDGDSAGQRAAYRAVDLAFKTLTLGRSLKFVMLPEGQDPDDLVRGAGSGAFSALVASATPLHEFFILRRRLEMRAESPEERAMMERQLYLDIEPITDQILRKYYRSHLRLRLTEFFSGAAKDISIAETRKLRIALGGNRLVATILGILVEYPALIGDYVEKLMKLEIDSEPYDLFRSEIYKIFVEYEDISVSAIYDRIDRRFFAVLQAVHGDEFAKPIRDSSGNVQRSVHVPRGHRLKQLFPKIALDPPLELVMHTLNFLFSKAEMAMMEVEYFQDYSTMTPDEFGHHHRAIVEKRESLTLEEQELFDAYEVWGGRREFGTHY